MARAREEASRLEFDPEHPERGDIQAHEKFLAKAILWPNHTVDVSAKWFVHLFLRSLNPLEPRVQKKSANLILNWLLMSLFEKEVICLNVYYSVLWDLWVNEVCVYFLWRLDLKTKKKIGTIIPIRH